MQLNLRSISTLVILIVFCLGASANAQTKTEPAKKTTPVKSQDKEKQKLHAKLAKYLTGTKWKGNFSMDGKDKMRTEYYEILSAEKSEYGDKWNLIARIKYGGKDMTLPLPPLDIKFAGKTPVITVNKVYIPKFGTFDARVLIRKGKYAGTWAHNTVGGHMVGTIEKMSAEEIAASKKNVLDVKGEK